MRHQGVLATVGCTALLFLWTTVTPLDAQTRKFDFEARAGVAAPGGELIELVDPGASFGLGFGYWVHPRIALRAAGALNLMTGTDADAAGPAGPDMTVWHYNGGALLRVLKPNVSRWSLDAFAGLGFTTLDADRFQLRNRSRDFSATYFTTNGGLQIAYAIGARSEIFAAAEAYLIFTKEGSTRVFGRLRDDVDPDGFTTAWTFPVTAGFQIRFP